jgi:hypothetical protein
MDRRRIATLVSDLLCELAAGELFSLLKRRPRGKPGGLAESQEALIEIAYFESAFYGVLQCHSLRCDSTEAEVFHQEASPKGRNVSFNPLALHHIAEFTSEAAVKRYPVIREIISVLRNARKSAEEHNGGGMQSNRRFGVEKRARRRRAFEDARRF